MANVNCNRLICAAASFSCAYVFPASESVLFAIIIVTEQIFEIRIVNLQVPGALCVLQEAGETALVLEIGESLLRERLPKSFKQDIVLAVALAYVDISRDAMALSPPDFIQGCEVLERALKLLQVNI